MAIRGWVSCSLFACLVGMAACAGGTGNNGNGATSSGSAGHSGSTAHSGSSSSGSSATSGSGSGSGGGSASGSNSGLGGAGQSGSFSSGSPSSGSGSSGSGSSGSPSSGSVSSGSASSAGTGSSAGTPGGAGGDGGPSSGAGVASGSGGTPGTGGTDAGGSTGAMIRGPDPTAASSSTAGSYNVQSYSCDPSSGVRQTMAYDVNSAHIYYPTDATPPFAAVSIVPGFVSPESSIANWGPFLASHGIVVMTIGTSNPSTGASDTSVAPDVRGAALIDALETIKSENTRSASPLYGKIDTTRLAVSGWSMGGGGTLIDANTHPELKAVMAMCPWNPTGTYPNDTVPTFIFAGTADGLAGPPMPQNQYQSIPSTTPKILYEINGGSHFVANDPAGESGSIGLYGLSWMKVFLEGDDRYRQFLKQQPSDAAEYDSNL